MKRAIATCRVRPSAAAFLRIAEAYRAELRAALDDVVRTMGLRKDAAKVVKTLASRQVEFNSKFLI